MSAQKLLFLILLFIPLCDLFAQQDSVFQALQQLPSKYYKNVEKKIDVYSKRVTSKTTKTLKKLTKWENKIRRILEKTNPEIASKLFNPDHITFASILESYQKSEVIISEAKKTYDEYTDELVTRVKFLHLISDSSDVAKSKLINSVNVSALSLQKLESENLLLQKMIADRKKELISVALNHLKSNKYLKKVNKYSYYYVESIKNYKSLFSNPEKREEFVKHTLACIPAFKKFMNDNSQWGSMFGIQSSSISTQNLPGLQTRATLSSILQNRLGSNGPNSLQSFQNALQKGQAEIASLKNRLLGSAPAQEIEGLPNFKPNSQKTKTFLQRIEYGFNIQFEKSNNLFPATSAVAFTLGYKLNDKFSTGLGLSTTIGLGDGWDKVKITGQGVGIRSYLDWKFKKSLFISSGFEQNYNHRINSINGLGNNELWNQSALIGLTKQVKAGKNKTGKFQILVDLLAYKQIPAGNPIKIRTGVNLK